MAMFRLQGLIAAAFVAVLFAPPAVAEDADDGGIKIKKGSYPIAVPLGVDSDSDLAKTVQEIASFDMSVAGSFKVLDPSTFTADLGAEKLTIVPEKWKDVGAYGVMKYTANKSGKGVELEFKLYEVSKGDTAVLTKTYKGGKDDLRELVHRWCNEVVKHYTGEYGFFGSKIAYVTKKKGKSTVMVMDFDGHGPYAVTRNKSINMLPDWSPGGGQIAFTSYMRNNPDLYVVSAGGGRPKRISKAKGMNTGASWSPDGSKIALTLSKDGNPEIYVIDAATGAELTRITDNKAIDTGAAWSPDGSEIAFVSDRTGSPQVYVVSASGGKAKKVSKNGNYNTTPTWSPKGRVLAYTTRDGNFDIVTLDLDTGALTRITQDEGNNEEPSFSPNGKMIAFASTRSGGTGIYLARADGKGKAVQVHKGAATGIDWGPAPSP